MENYDKAMKYATIATESDGQAMEKMGIYTDSLEAKMNKLTSAFEQLIYNEDIVRFFGSLLDIGTALLKVLTAIVDNPLGRFVTGVTALTASISAAMVVIQAFRKSAKMGENLIELAKMFNLVSDAAEVSAKNIALVGGKLALIIAGVSAVIKILDILVVTEKEQQDIIDEVNQKYQENINNIKELNEELEENKNKLDEINNAPISNRSEQWKKDKEALEDNNEELQRRIELEERLEQYNRKKVDEESRKLFKKKFDSPEQVKERYNNIIAQREQAEKRLQSIQSKFLNGKMSEQDFMFQKGLFDKLMQDTGHEIDLMLSSLVNIVDNLDESNVKSKDIIDTVNSISEQWSDINKKVDESKYSAIEGNELLEHRLQTARELRDTESDMAGTVSQFDRVASTLATINSLNDEVKTSGAISVEQLKNIVAMYPQLESQVAEYLSGLITEKQLIEDLGNYYNIDLEKYNDYLNQKMQYDTAYYNALGFNDSEFVNMMADNYNVDLKNAKTIAEAKELINMQTIGKLSFEWAKYYDAELGVMREMNFGLLSSQEKGEYIQVKKAIAQMEAAKEKLNNLAFEHTAKSVDIFSKSIDKSTESAKNAQKAYDDLLKMVISMLKQEKEAEKEALNEELDRYNKIIDARKKALDQLKEEQKYKKDIEKRGKEISDLENELAELSNDTSREAAAKRQQIEEELQNKKTELEDEQLDHSIDSQKDALDKEYDDFKKNTDDKIKTIDEYLKHTGELTKQAMELIEEHANSTYERLIEWNRIYGDGINQTVSDAWNNAKKAVDSYTASLRAAGVAGSIGGAGGTVKPSGGGGSTTGNIPYTVYDMNGKKIKTTNSYEDAKASRGSAGYFVNSKGQPNTMHGGIDSGFVGNAGGNEEFIKALKGEAFITKYQQDRFMDRILPSMVSQFAGASNPLTVGNLMNINVSGNMDESVIPKIKEIAQDTLKQLNNGMFRKGYIRRTNTVSI